MRDEIVDRLVDRAPLGELAEVFGEQIEVERVGVVPVYEAAFLEGE